MDIPELPGARLLGATAADAPELLVLQRCCWVQEAILNNTFEIPALNESLDDVHEWIRTWGVWLVRLGPRLVGAVRARLEGTAWEIGRLMVAPDHAGRGLGRFLLTHAERQAPPAARTTELFTGAASARNITLYRRAGFRLTPQAGPVDGHIRHAVYLVKPRG